MLYINADEIQVTACNKSATYAKARMRPRFLLPFSLPGGLNRLYESIATTVFILVFYYD